MSITSPVYMYIHKTRCTEPVENAVHASGERSLRAASRHSASKLPLRDSGCGEVENRICALLLRRGGPEADVSRGERPHGSYRRAPFFDDPLFLQAYTYANKNKLIGFNLRSAANTSACA